MASERLKGASEVFLEAVNENDREKLRDARDVLTAISDQADGEAADLAAVATRLLERDTAAVGFGECQEADPFAPAYIVIVDGRAFWRCQHDPSHDVPA